MGGAIAIILFFGWFYIGQLGSTESAAKEKTTVNQIKDSEQVNAKADEGTESTLTRIDSQGAVGIEVTPLPEKSSSDELVFEIVMNTHSVDLLQYQLNELAELSFGATNTTAGEFEWELSSKDSHHLVGYLKWMGPVMEDNVTLEIKNIDNIPSRVFEWEKLK